MNFLIKNKLLLIVSIILAFAACKEKCEEKTDPYLTTEELSWINCYKEGQIIIFHNDKLNQNDSLKVGSKVCYLQEGLHESGNCYKHEFQTCGFILSSLNYGGEKLNLSITHEVNEAVIKTSSSYILRIGGETQDNVEIKGVKYNDVFITHDTSGLYYQDSSIIYKIYFNKNKGVLRFDKKNSEYWELVN